MHNTQKHLEVLVLHENISLLKKVKNYLKGMNYKVFAATTSQFALLIINKRKPQVIITNLRTKDFLKEKNLFYTLIDFSFTPLIILIITDEQDETLFRELPQDKIFDVIHLSESINETLLLVLESVKKYLKERYTLDKYLKEYEFRWTKQIEWLLWKEYHKTIYHTRFSKKMIENVRNSMLQGLGVGSFISYVELMDLKKKETEEGVLIPKNLFEKLKESSRKLDIWFQKLDNVIHYMDRTFPAEKISSDDFQRILQSTIEKIKPFQSIKNHTIQLGKIHYRDSIIANEEALEIILKEVLINAFKYSPENSTIDIIMIDNKSNVLLGIINDILEIQGGVSGLPEEFENQVFEPMFRINHFYDERFIGEDFTLGIGLSIVKLYLKYFDGNIYLKEIIDYNRDIKKRILCGITFTK